MNKKPLGFNYLGLVCAAAMIFPAAAFAQTANGAAPTQEATAAYVRDWTSDGTRDRLLANAEKYLGNVSESYIALPPEAAVAGNKELVATQFAFAFHGYPEPEAELPGGERLFVAADPESQVEKALLVTANDRTTIRTLALFHRSCVGPTRFDRTAKKFTTCPRLATLTFFVHDHDTLAPDVKREVVHWVKAFGQRNNAAVKKLHLKTESQFIRAIKVDVRSIPETAT